jgi:hypothetical protein
MQYIIIIICAIILPILSFKESKPKFCMNCKYFLTDKKTDEFSKCSLFPLEPNNETFLVNGILKDEILDYYYCTTTREFDDMCGKEGFLYKKKYQRKPVYRMKKSL